MVTPLLQTKWVVPPLRKDAVSRTRLLNRLELEEHTKVLLVSAPAGFGKTTLASDWLRRRDLNAAWLSLDAEDNDLRRLLAHLFSAVHAAVPTLGAAELELLQEAKSLAADAIIAPLLNQAASLKQPVCIVLDDYHVITNSKVHAVFDFVLEYAPPQVKLALLTRSDPPLKLATLRARGQLLELRGDDLRFTQEEAGSFLDTSGLSVTDAQTEALTRRTEGWAAGLQVLALSLSGRTDGGDFIEELAGSNRFLLDYLLDEVFDKQPPHVQTFLLKTSLLDSFCPSLCAAVLEPEDIPVAPAELLAELEKANLFLRPLDADNTWFRYHQLFRDVLLHRLKTLYPESIAPLRRNAADWYAATGDLREALEQLLLADLYSEAADLIKTAGPALLWQRGDGGALEVYLSRLPSDVLGLRPDLLVLRAWAAHLLGDTLTISPLLSEAELLLDTLGAAEPEAIRAEITALKSFAARMEGDLEEALELSEAALAALPDEAHALRSLVNGNLGEVYFLQGDLAQTKRYHREESRLAERAGVVLPSRFALWRVSDVQTLSGELEAAKKTNHTMLNLNKLRSVDALGFADVQLGIIALAQYDLTEAERRLSVGTEIGERLGNPRVFLPAYGPLAQVLQAAGRADEAQEVLDEGKKLGERHGLSWTWGLPALSAYQAYLDLRQGEVERAFAWMERTGLNTPAPKLSFARHFCALVAARILLAKGEPEAALKLLKHPTVNQARAVDRGVLTALAQDALGQTEAALGSLSTAVATAQKNRHVFAFVDEGEAAKRLLETLKDKGRQPAYVSALLGAFPETETEALEPVTEVQGTEFNERERSVLRLMAGRLSNKEIARELDLSTNTVKWYAKGLFEKLGVHGRLKAASKAQELGLV